MMNNSQTLCAALKTTVNQITSYVVQEILSSCFKFCPEPDGGFKKIKIKSVTGKCWQFGAFVALLVLLSVQSSHRVLQTE